jgi:hypothetical protein
MGLTFGTASNIKWNTEGIVEGGGQGAKSELARANALFTRVPASC